jgi:hypothetical protein
MGTVRSLGHVDIVVAVGYEAWSDCVKVPQKVLRGKGSLEIDRNEAG